MKRGGADECALTNQNQFELALPTRSAAAGFPRGIPLLAAAYRATRGLCLVF